MQTIRMLKKAAVGLPPNTIPERKKGSGRPRKTSKRTDAMLKREVMVSPTVTAGDLKAMHPHVLGGGGWGGECRREPTSIVYKKT